MEREKINNVLSDLLLSIVAFNFLTKDVSEEYETKENELIQKLRCNLKDCDKIIMKILKGKEK